MNDYRNMSSQDIEQDVEESRGNIGATLNELRSRVKPRRLANEALAYARETGGASLLNNVGTKIRDNPVPLALIGAGIAWLASGRGLPNFRQLLGSEDGEDGGYPQRMDLAAAKAYRPPRRNEIEAAQELQSELEYDEDEYGDTSNFDGEDSPAEELKVRARDAAHRARVALSDAGDSVSGVAGDAAGRARAFGEKAREAARKAQDRAKTIADEQPLTLALAGLAIGAVIGALVRTTARETEFMGEASDRVKTRAKDKAREGLGEASTVAERTLETVREEVNARADM